MALLSDAVFLEGKKSQSILKKAVMLREKLIGLVGSKGIASRRPGEY